MNGLEVVGLEQFNQRLKEFRESALPVFLEACNEQAKMTQAAMKAAAPVGPTGNLKKAIKRLKAREDRGKQHAVVYISRKTAPHFHLVVFGTSERFTKYRRAYIGGRWVSFKKSKNKNVRLAKEPKSQGRMAPNPFFRQEVERSLPQFVNKMMERAQSHVSGFKNRRRR